jgi:hypothetical protein
MPLAHSFPIPSTAKSVVEHVEPSAANALGRERWRQLVAAAREGFNNTVPMPYILCWASRWEDLQFTQAEIKVLSDGESATQTFSEWCLWDTGAQVSMIPGGGLTNDVKGGANVPDAGFLPMEIVWVVLLLLQLMFPPDSTQLGSTEQEVQ